MKEMIKKMREEKGGFTIAELLIVVAIVGVLVAIAIPVFTSQLNEAKYATDEANARSLYGELSADYMANGNKHTFTADPLEITTAGGTITVKKGDVVTNTYKFSGLATVKVTLGTQAAGPKVVLGAYTDAHPEQTWGGNAVTS